MTAPVATYRIQFRGGMDFERARALIPYLKRLGVSHLYASPVFTASSGSTHGYDVTDCNSIDPVLGGREGLRLLAAGLHEAGLGLIVDIVPNHMAASLENAWWASVVEWGEESPFARHFDIDWNEKLTLPVLGQSFADCVASGEIALSLDRDAGRVALGYFDNRFPLHPGSYEEVFARFETPLAEALARRAAEAAPGDDAEFHDAIRQLCAAGDDKALEEEMARCSREAGFLEWVHGEQPYRLMFWKEARRHLSYRRFFEVTGLVGLRVEDEAVFEDSHRLILELVETGVVDGLRVDHVDGLADPGGYLKRLRAAVGPSVPILVEKIVEPGEALPPEWPIEGTTGYEFIAALAGLMTDQKGLERLGEAYGEQGREAIGRERRAAKTEIATRNFEGELTRIVGLCAESLGEAGTPVPGAAEIEAALVHMIVAFPVYRTYGGANGMRAADKALMAKVVADARGTAPAELATVIDAVAGLLTGAAAADGSAVAAELRTRFQQLTGPVMAKAIEDTLFYRYNRLIGLNEVGGDVELDAGGAAAFHEAMAERADRQPFGLSATATHDTKRGEDARARLYALSEFAEEWCAGVERWRVVNGEGVRAIAGGQAPEPRTEWLIYQAIAGVWPEELEVVDGAGLGVLSKRFAAYLEKALREAKLRTSWTTEDGLYEKTVLAYAARLLAPDNRAFLDDFEATLRPIVRLGHVNSLAQTLLKLAAPGIPDIYQGSEGRDLSLVDPDNRRQPDYPALAQTLSNDAEGGLSKPYACKQRLIARGLAARGAQPQLFAAGSYRRLVTRGRHADRVVAFARQQGGEAALVVVPRLGRFLLDEAGAYRSERWDDTAISLPSALCRMRFRNIVNDGTLEGSETLRVTDMLRELPVALFVTGEATSGTAAAGRARFARQAWASAPAPREAGRYQEVTMDTDRTKEIERRAYELWEAEGKPAGREHAHWDQAEREFADSEGRDPANAFPSQQENDPFLTGQGSEKKKKVPAKPRGKK